MFPISSLEKLFILILILGWLSFQSCGVNKSTEFQKSSSQNTALDTIRFATYNVALFRNKAGKLEEDLKSGMDTQIQNLAAVIQHVRPDVIALMEVDYDPSGLLLNYFQQNYLSKSQSGEQPINYTYALSVPSNTGFLSGQDLNNDKKISLPEDAFGFGRYEGQYAFALLSKYPFDTAQIRSFQKFIWAEMPDAKKPLNENGSPYYSREAWDIFRLSSKNHIDIPIQLPSGDLIHTILAHPTPPVFDGPEDRNGLRNFDEIRLLRDYISGAKYLKDDKGKKGGLKAGSSFVIMGDLNADPVDGDSYPGAIDQLLDAPNIHAEIAKGGLIPKSKGGKAHNQKAGDKGDPAFDTSFFGKRIDYVLPSKDLNVIASGVFWPAEGEALFNQVKNKNASDHLLVWMDLVIGGKD